MISKINGKLFADMIIQGAQNLSNNADLVDSLNVYPVPDGDTGTKYESYYDFRSRRSRE
ncbi:Dihydroxyacetone kinase family protein [Staphylococcus aureus]|nr:Dihydroxyacetone kinase family protein [Staphylococcus aureus]